jgi:predicted site-specific integrase-resolvase
MCKKELLDYKDIMRMFNISKSTAYRYINSGLLGPVYTLGGRKVSKKEVEKRKEYLTDETVPVIPIEKLQRESLMKLRKKYL